MSRSWNCQPSRRRRSRSISPPITARRRIREWRFRLRRIRSSASTSPATTSSICGLVGRSIRSNAPAATAPPGTARGRLPRTSTRCRAITGTACSSSPPRRGAQSPDGRTSVASSGTVRRARRCPRSGFSRRRRQRPSSTTCRYSVARGELEINLIREATDELDEGDDFDPGTVAGFVADISRSWDRAADEVVMPLTVNPPLTAATVRDGAVAFAEFSCVKCHARDAAGSRSADVGVDIWGRTAYPANLAMGMLHGGRRPIDIYRRISSGINGTPMPSSKDPNSTIGETPQQRSERIWHLVHFVTSVIENNGVPPAEQSAIDEALDAGRRTRGREGRRQGSRHAARGRRRRRHAGRRGPRCGIHPSLMEGQRSWYSAASPKSAPHSRSCGPPRRPSRPRSTPEKRTPAPGSGRATTSPTTRPPDFFWAWSRPSRASCSTSSARAWRERIRCS